MTKTRWIFISIVSAILITFSLYRAFTSSTAADAAAWAQVILGALGIPVLYYELSQIRKAIEQRPAISVGVASVNELPLSNIRNLKALSTQISVSQGYPCFWLVVRNQGKVAAKSVKIHLEYNPPKRKSLYLPVIDAKDWLGDNRYTFKKVNNADFVFIGGSDWVLHANDTDMFDFQMTTAVAKHTEKGIVRERPDLGDYTFTCMVWADGLDKPLMEALTISVKESIKKSKAA